MFKSKHERNRGFYEEPPKSRADFGTRIIPEFVIDLKRRHGTTLVGEIIGTKSGTYYVIRAITDRGFEATQLGDYTKSRPRIVTMPNDAKGIMANPISDIALANNHNEYRDILLEIKAEGGDVEIPPKKGGGFDIF